jgi:hypothetical protein
VDLVEDDVANEVEALGVLVDQVAQDLGRHHDDRRFVVDRVLAGDQTDHRFAVLAHEVVVFLVAQSLERSRVESFDSVLQSPEDRVLGDHRLAARGRRADEHASSPLLELFDRLTLERVELERQASLELV